MFCFHFSGQMAGIDPIFPFFGNGLSVPAFLLCHHYANQDILLIKRVSQTQSEEVDASITDLG